jgi:hypothetical protein
MIWSNGKSSVCSKINAFANAWRTVKILLFYFGIKACIELDIALQEETPLKKSAYSVSGQNSFKPRRVLHGGMVGSVCSNLG